MSQRWELLDWGRISDIIRSKARFEDLVEFHWHYYSELEFQRNQIREKLNRSLREQAVPFEFSQWQRIVRYRYSLTPLSTKGSLADPGGRFNVGKIEPIRYPVFPALYVASDKQTGLAEVLGRSEGSGTLIAEELALTKPDSISVVSVSGKLESLLDIRERSNLVGFVNLVKHFRLSGSVVLQAKRLGFQAHLIRTVKELGAVLEQPNWREWPMLFDVPSTCQVFGAIVVNAGIEGSLYSSVLTNKPCLAIFPQNFLNSSAYVELDDPVPSDEVQRRIDASNFKNCL